LLVLPLAASGERLGAKGPLGVVSCCQRDIAAKIIEKKADYILALKGNQGTLREDANVDWLQARHQWPGLNAVVVVESQREINGKTTRFYITSLVMPANAIGPSSAASSSSSGTGQVMPITAARRMYSPIAVRPIPTDRAITRSLAPQAYLRRRTSRTFRIDNLSAAIGPPVGRIAKGGPCPAQITDAGRRTLAE
jgi:hypothetical protein